MMERVLYDILVSGVNMLRDTPGMITNIFLRDGMLDAEEAEALELLFRNKQTPSVHLSYPRVDASFPAFFIMLGSEGHQTLFMGDEGAYIDEGDDAGQDEYAAIFSHQYNLFVYSQHPNVTLAYYQLLKWIVLGNVHVLKAHGAMGIRLQGEDLMPDSTTMPAGLFVRRASLSFARQYTQLPAGGRLERAWKVRGIHLGADGAPGEDMGGVVAHVTVPEES